MSKSGKLAVIEEERRLRGILPRLELKDIAAEAVGKACRQFMRATQSFPFAQLAAEGEPEHKIDTAALEATVLRLEQGERELTQTEAEQIYFALERLANSDRSLLESDSSKFEEALVEQEVLDALRNVFRSFVERKPAPAS